MSGHGGGGADGLRWNDETQRWETGNGPGAPVTGNGPGAPATGNGAGSGGGSGPVVPPQPPPPEYPPAYGPEYGPEGGPAYAPAYGPEYTPVHGPGADGRPYAPVLPPPPSRPRPRAALAAGVAVAVLAAGSAGTWLVWGRDDGKPPAAGPPVSATAATEEPPPGSTGDTPSPSVSATSTPSDDVPPPGYRAVKDLKSFTIAIPEGWNRTESDQGVFYNAPDGRSLLQVFVVTERGLTPYEALRAVSENSRTAKPGYEEIGLERVTGDPDAPADAAELVYAYSREGGRRKVVDRAFTAEDGNHYAILAAGPEADWPKQREVLRVALDFFRPGPY
ncbi:hypothetical protein [Streptomyces sp. NPDC001744]|uniref:hypothetical protein n=1 Tax=Streptomyces sp. NPDC001744 TaxID=3364606 RepID=UPI00367CD6FA